MSQPNPIPYTLHTPASTIAADNAAHIKGKIILTTGVTLGGIGATFVCTIARHSPRLLILAGRSMQKLQETANAIHSDPRAAGVAIRLLDIDLASPPSIRRAATEVLHYPEPHIDVLVNSAGIMPSKTYQANSQGIELAFAANHIGHFLLTNLLVPKLLAAPAPRVVSVSSEAHHFSGIRFDDVNFCDGQAYDRISAYGQSKTAKLGTRGLRAFSLHPGAVIGTNMADAAGLGREEWEDVARRDREMGWVRELEWTTLEECAATHVLAAFDPRLEGLNGAYLEQGNVSKDGVWKTASGEGDAERLWVLSEELVGEKFEY